MISVILQYIKCVLIVERAYLRGYEGHEFRKPIYPKTVELLKRRYDVIERYFSLIVKVKKN